MGDGRLSLEEFRAGGRSHPFSAALLDLLTWNYSLQTKSSDICAFRTQSIRWMRAQRNFTAGHCSVDFLVITLQLEGGLTTNIAIIIQKKDRSFKVR